MRKPQISLLAVSVSVASLLLASTTTFAHGNYKENYKGEAMPCPVELILQDGLYVGAQAGYDNYRVVDEVDSFLFDADAGVAGEPAFGVDPRLAANGAVGGLFIGYGKYFGPDWYNAYLGIEIFGNWSAAQTDYELATTQGTAGTSTLFTTSVKAKDNFGISALPGIKINNASLFYVRLGYNWAKVDISETYFDDGAAPISSSLDKTKGGFNYGVGIESTFMPGWSVRGEYAHTGFGSRDTDFGTEIATSDNQFMLGLIYHITI